MAVTLTEKAAKHVASYLSKRGKGYGLRLGVRTSGCSGSLRASAPASAGGPDITVTGPPSAALAGSCKARASAREVQATAQAAAEAAERAAAEKAAEASRKIAEKKEAAKKETARKAAEKKAAAEAAKEAAREAAQAAKPDAAAPPPAPAVQPEAPHIRYMHPSNRALTWSGEGTMPDWINAWLVTGGTLYALEIAAEKLAPRPIPASFKQR